LQLVGVAGDQRVGGEHDVEAADQVGEGCGRVTRALVPVAVGRRVSVPAGAVMDEHGQLGGEPADLAFPVAQHRHRAHHQRGAGRRVGQDRGDQLGGLAQPHVVGEARPQAQPAEERQPGHAPLLVGAQRTIEPGRIVDRGDRARHGIVEQVAQPAGGHHAVHLQAVGCAQVVEAQPGPQQVGGARLTLGPDRRDQVGNVVGVDEHPLAPQPNHLRLCCRGLLEANQVGAGQLPPAQCRLPGERHQRVHTEGGTLDRSRWRGR